MPWQSNRESGLEIIGHVTSIEINTECIGECRIGAVAPLSDTLTHVRRLGYGTLVT